MYGSLAHTGISWPIYVLSGLLVASGGALVKTMARFRSR